MFSQRVKSLDVVLTSERAAPCCGQPAASSVPGLLPQRAHPPGSLSLFSSSCFSRLLCLSSSQLPVSKIRTKSEWRFLKATKTSLQARLPSSPQGSGCLGFGFHRSGSSLLLIKAATAQAVVRGHVPVRPGRSLSRTRVN